MRCSKAHILINDHVDHLLGKKQAQNLESHLQKCPRCRDLLAEMKLMVNEAKHLEMIPPSENLWPAIRDKIEGKRPKAVVRPPQKRPFFGFSLYPARLAYGISTLLAVIVLGSLLYYGTPFIRSGRNDFSKNELKNYTSAGQDYQSAIETLDKAITEQKVQLNPELAEVFKKNLEIINNSIRECQVAIKERHENQVANLNLLICYRKKLELLNDMKKIPMQIG